MKVFWKRTVTAGCLAMGVGVAGAQAARHNVIIFVADGLRRGSVTAEDMPTFLKVRQEGVDFRNSHSVFPTFTTANASAIATGHGLGDTGDYSNALYPGVWLTAPDGYDVTGYVVPFLENDVVLANMNNVFDGDYLGEETLLTTARKQGFNVASVGKLGPTAIQQIEAVQWSREGRLETDGAVIVDDSTGAAKGLPLPVELKQAMLKADLPLEAPLRTNGYEETSQQSNGYAGDAAKAGTLEANVVQEKWFADVSTKVLLPRFAAAGKPFVLLFWSRDPDGTQHDEGDSLQQLAPGINGPTSKRGLRNADRCLKQLLDWLDAHPAVKANTDVVLTSDHGFATISRREVAADGAMTGEVSSGLDYLPSGKESPEPKGTLPTGFLAVDLAVRGKMRLYDAGVRASTGDAAFEELTVGGDKSQHPSGGSALLGDQVHGVQRIDGSDAKLIVASNGGSDMIYVPSGDKAVVQSTLRLLTQLDYVGGLFVDDRYCTAPGGCGGALPLSTVGLVGASSVPRPAIVVTYKVFYGRKGDLQSALQVSDSTLQEGQGMHGGFGREQTLNSMAAMGPDFKRGFADEAPMGNIDIVPTLAKVLGVTMTPKGKLMGRVDTEALKGGAVMAAAGPDVAVSKPAADGGGVTVLEYQKAGGVTYLDRACFVATGVKSCD